MNNKFEEINTEKSQDNIVNRKKRTIVLFIFATLFLIVSVLSWIYFAEIKNLFFKEKEIIKEEIIDSSLLELSEEFKLCQTLDYDKTPYYGENDVKDIFYKITELVATQDVKGCAQLNNYSDKCYEEQRTFMVLNLMKQGVNLLEYFRNNNLNPEDIIEEAIIYNDIKICDKSQDAVQKSICQSLVSSDIKYCHTLNAGKTNECLNIDGKKDIDRGCDVNIKESKSLCTNSYYLIKAFKENNVNECLNIDNITGRFTRLYCLSLLSPNSKEEINKFYRSNACYEKYAINLAKIKNDPIVCEKIPLKDNHNKIQYEECLSQFK